MGLAAGTRFGAYEIIEPLGQGGMGEVYRARDLELERDVAIKVLPASFASDESRVARFEQEAKTLAALNHSNIAQVYGLARQDSQTAIVMELVDGPTLAERIEQGPLPADEALNIAMQIADALEAAHDSGIIHRDLKPANVKVRHDGTVKVLDFGIAKALDIRATSGPGTPALTTPAMTAAGIVLGTAAYMSPEQARGKPVDQRADIWSFGVLLYEMLTGQPAFAGEDVTITLARVLERDTNLDTLPKSVTPAVKHTIKLCLQKDVRKRLRHIGDVRLGLEGVLEAEAGPATLQSPPMQRRLVPIALAVAAAAMLVTAAIAWSIWPQPEPERVSRFDQILPPSAVVRRNGRSTLTIAPDGSAFVYNTAIGLLLRRIDDVEPHVIPGTEPDLTHPFFSPDGTEVAYWDPANVVYRVAIDGATPPVRVAEGIGNPYGASWEDDGTMLLGQSEGIVRLPARGGEAELVIAAGEGELIYGPTLLPGGEWVLFAISPLNEPLNGRIFIQSLQTGERRDLGENGSDARYVPSGHLVYARDYVLLAAPFDLGTLAVTGNARPLVPDVKRANAGQSAVAQYAIADDGTLVYLTGESTTTDSTIVWVDRAGREEMLAVPAGAYNYLRISPDGSRVVLDDGIGDNGFWIWDFNNEVLTTLTLGDVAANFPIWSPDGASIVYSAGSGDRSFHAKAANNTGAIRELTAGRGLELRVPAFFTPSGGEIVFASTGFDIGVMPIESGDQIDWLINGPANEINPALSPNGRWLAYESDESGRPEVYVRPFPDVDADRVQVSNTGGEMPVWSPDGSELFYLNNSDVGAADSLDVARVTATDDTFAVTARSVLMDRWLYVGTFATAERAFDIAPDGQRFLAIRNEAIAEDTANIQIVQNWFAELQRLVPVD